MAEEGLPRIHVLDIDRALQALSRENSRLSAKSSKCIISAGSAAEEIAAVVNRSAEAVRHDIRLGRAWVQTGTLTA